MHSRRVMDVKPLLRDAIRMIKDAQDASYAEFDVRLNNIETLLWTVLEEVDELERAKRHELLDRMWGNPV